MTAASSESVLALLGDGESIGGQAALKGLLHALARPCGWSVGVVHWDPYPASFHWAEARREGDALAVLVHAAAPVIALSRTLPAYRNLEFVDDPSLASTLAALGSGLRVVGPDVLGRGLDEADRAFLRSLGGGWPHGLDYWRPATVGDVLFNWWD